jgi:3-phosphoshikimate 1-carboxyvinyltransferase
MMPQTIRTTKGPIHAKPVVSGSKSITNRALLLASLADGVSEISNLQLGEETKNLIKALHQVGVVAQLNEKGHSCIIAGGNGAFPKKQATVWCADSKMVAKFLMIACAAAPGVYYFDGSLGLRKKSITQLLNILCRQGAQLIPSDTTKMPFTLVGADSLEGGEIILDSSITSQLVSALLMIAPFARSPFNFTIVDLISQPYIDMTCTMMAEFSVLVHRVHQGQFMVPVPQRYQGRDYVIEPDLSLAMYFLAAAAITGGEVSIVQTKRNLSKQPEVKFLNLLEKMGCKLQETHSALTLKGPTELQGVEVSLRDFSDVFLILAAIAPFAVSPTIISHVGFLRHKELQRIKDVQKQLIKMGIKVEAEEDWIKIHPGTFQGGVIDAYNDPRIAMAFSVIGLKVPGIVINGEEKVSKIYPDFFAILDKLTEKVSACA